MGELRIIGKTSIAMFGESIEGDLRLTWRKDKTEEVALAEKTFNEYINKGWLAVGEVSGKKMQIFTFTSDLEKIVLAPVLMGG